MKQHIHLKSVKLIQHFIPNCDTMIVHIWIFVADWTLIQRRVDSSTNFYVEWDPYEVGFGNTSSNYWAGLSFISASTSPCPAHLLINLEALDGETRYAFYQSFIVGDAASKYLLNVTGYCGTMGTDQFGNGNNGMMFSTVDNDNDIYGFNCAQMRVGGWWYQQCGNTNLNGVMNSDPLSDDATNAYWRSFRQRQSMKTIEMKIVINTEC